MQNPSSCAHPDTATPDHHVLSLAAQLCRYDAPNANRSSSGVAGGAGVSSTGATAAVGAVSAGGAANSSRSHESIHAAASAASLTTRPSLRCDASRTATAIPPL